MSCVILLPNGTTERKDASPTIESAARIALCLTSKGGSFDYLCRRVLGVSLALLLLTLLTPVLLLIGILIKLDSPGPAIYRQERVRSRRHRAINGQIVWGVQTFTLYKFRSMRRDADPAVHREFVQWFCDGKVAAVEGKVAPGELTETLFKLKNDSRVTRLGRFLRRTSLDELPQLINVLKGEMTLVGPRPVPPYEMAHYKQTHYERFAAVPGITGLWQVQGRGRVPFEEMIRMDMEYVRNCSLWLDLKILVSTVPAVFRGSGAH